MSDTSEALFQILLASSVSYFGHCCRDQLGRALTSFKQVQQAMPHFRPYSASLTTHPRALLLMPQAVIPQIPARFIGYILQNISCLLLPVSGGKLHNEPSTPPPHPSAWDQTSLFLSFHHRLCCVGKLGWGNSFSIKCKFSACFLPWLHRGKKAEIKSS